MADQQHASSVGGDPAHMPDGWVASVNTLTGNKGLLGQNPGNPTSRQDIPGSKELSVKEQYGFQPNLGPKVLLGQNTVQESASPLHDRPTVPSPEFPGESGTTNMGQQGDPIDWNSVAPYKYGEFPKDSISTGGSRTNPAPLT